MLTNLIRKTIGVLKRSFPGLQRAIATPDPSLEDEYLRTLAADPELSLEQKVRYWRREGFIFSDLVQDALAPGSRLVVLDVGARDAFLDPRWRGFKGDRIEFLGFEADAAEATRLNEEARARGAHCRYFGIGVWREKVKSYSMKQARREAAPFTSPMARW